MFEILRPPAKHVRRSIARIISTSQAQICPVFSIDVA